MTTKKVYAKINKHTNITQEVRCYRRKNILQSKPWTSGSISIDCFYAQKFEIELSIFIVKSVSYRLPHA